MSLSCLRCRLAQVERIADSLYFDFMKVALYILTVMAVFTGGLCHAQALQTDQQPRWFQVDVARKAPWLPVLIRQAGVESAYQKRLALLPADVQEILLDLQIPKWMIALIPSTDQNEISNQIRNLVALAGPSSESKLAQRAEQLLLFGGAAHLPTPGDRTTGRSLGPEGCSAVVARYVLAQLNLEFPAETTWLNSKIITSQSSVELKAFFLAAARTNPSAVSVTELRFEDLTAFDVMPGNIMIAQKPGGTHVFAWTRVPLSWKWSETAKMAVGNTGLAQFGAPRMILAQEYLTSEPELAGELEHNEHGPLNSPTMIRRNGAVSLSDPRTNVYAARGSSFIIIRF